MSTTPNMGLFESTPLVTVGPTWASHIEDSLLLIDAHDHTTGKGLPIAAAALNINADLPFGSYQATGLKAAAFTSQSSTLATASRIYVVSGDLYYNNAAGTAIQVTSGTSVNVAGVGGITGLAGTTGAVTYSNITKTFTFTQDAGKTASLIAGTVTVSEPGVSSASLINIKSPVALAGSYDITFPATLPVATKYLQVSAAGQLVATDALDNSTLEVSAGSMRIKDLGVTTAKLAATSITAAKLGNDIAGDGLTGANGVALAVNPDGVGIEISADQVRLKASGVTQVKLANSNYAVSASTGVITQVGAGTTAIASQSLTVQNSGRLVLMQLVGTTGATLSYVQTGGAAPWTAYIQFTVDGTSVARLQIGEITGNIPVFSPSSFAHLMPLSAGARTIAANMVIVGAAGFVTVDNVALLVAEL
jgi:hypothetical protein